MIADSRYSLDREIGRGGTAGVVWLGRDEVLGRRVALNRIGLVPGANRTDLARAEREARLSARLNHPHVVAVFDVVVDIDSDARWLVMSTSTAPHSTSLSGGRASLRQTTRRRCCGKRPTRWLPPTQRASRTAT